MAYSAAWYTYLTLHARDPQRQVRRSLTAIEERHENDQEEDELADLGAICPHKNNATICLLREVVPKQTICDLGIEILGTCAICPQILKQRVNGDQPPSEIAPPSRPRRLEIRGNEDYGQAAEEAPWRES